MHMNLTCELTQEEISIYSAELARITSQQAEIEAEKKEVMSDFAAKLNKCIADSRVLARKITTRREDRPVECDYEYDYNRGMVYTIRLDTGATISQRKLTDEERQERLDFEGQQERKELFEDVKELKMAYGETAGPTLSELCQQCHEATGCSKCCRTCKDKCNAEQICRWPGQHDDDQKDEPCPKCEGDGVYYEDGIEDGGGEVFCDCLAGTLAKARYEQEQAKDRDTTCGEWRECSHAERCFAQDPKGDPVCYKDQQTKQNEPEKDGITTEKIETLQVELKGKALANYRMQVRLAMGDSGTWYVGTHIHTPGGGNSCYPYPKFSEKYASREEAIKAGAEILFNDTLDFIKDNTKIQDQVKDCLSEFVLKALS